ncbi:MAG: 5'-nucleotidase, lipoprotein e(P4) family [Flavobacteriales bacterium]|nr:5'-nucleotidase, lipoprotein e(P4) family [Flavobacteriales bacterium]MBK6884795.1 5'-nucleotidase, lipoprotein e(P4) family [Flavobacteriales bacterium]MBK7102116.1 5'-nucleotidase, lipoprotein e(P4) family [Flavobacteriales bacterium]MBK7112587.1 5'-nucleotidase, lipoprotein e(P4) family [Flavobacteriales bacterium]MBK7620425.1 5'-nucleotidase, lipoprotein e(P4) family [Flavobacteriales bacterium]
MMNRSLLPFFVIGLLACNPPKAVVVAPPVAYAPSVIPDPEAELSQMGVDAVLWQSTSAEVYWIYQQAYAHAKEKLAKNLATESAKPAAVVVDIDETVLDNSPYQVGAIRNARTFDQADWKVWTDKASAAASPGALDFLLHTKSLGCEVFYITNRDIRERASTLKNLNDLGFPFADEAHLLLMDGASDKTERRANVSATHRIVLMVGDQLRDFDERFKDRAANYGKGVVDAMADSLSNYFILLPNPMYGTYRDAIQGKESDAERLRRTEEWFQRNGK